MYQHAFLKYFIVGRVVARFFHSTDSLRPCQMPLASFLLKASSSRVLPGAVTHIQVSRRSHFFLSSHDICVSNKPINSLSCTQHIRRSVLFFSNWLPSPKAHRACRLHVGCLTKDVVMLQFACTCRASNFCFVGVCVCVHLILCCNMTNSYEF